MRTGLAEALIRAAVVDRQVAGGKPASPTTASSTGRSCVGGRSAFFNGRKHRKAGAKTGLSCDFDPAAQQVGQALDDGKTKPDAPILVGVLPACLAERFEQTLAIFRRDAGAGVDNAVFQPVFMRAGCRAGLRRFQ
jgi:hypothetical protein